MKEMLKKLGYEAPRIEAMSFKVEQGYAGSGGGGGKGASTTKFTNVPVSWPA